ncbi:TRAP transporter substrate-binding protein [Desertibaculum subflavum]|uniref:TRAP transporter substrate-binding protein n=1 Tax=Desertibaculum subflavum TaxID=2268458 RepID=UPI000E66BFB7
MPRHLFATVSLAIGATLLVAAQPAPAQTLIYATQTTKNATDYRREIPAITAEELKRANAGIELKVHFEGELVTASELWRAVTGGSADIVSAFLPTTSGSPAEVLFTGLPALLGGSADIEKLAASEALKLFDGALRTHGAVLVGGYWDLLAIGSTGECITNPQQLDKLAVRGPGKAYDMLYASQGGITVPLPSPEIPRALKTGAVDSVTTTLSSMTVGNGHKYLKCITDPTVAVPGMVFVATLMSAKSFDALPPERQKAVLEAGRQMSVRVQAEANKATSATLDRIRADGVKIVGISPADVAAWRAAAERSAWAQFRKASPAADQMITAAAAAIAR